MELKKQDYNHDIQKITTVHFADSEEWVKIPFPLQEKYFQERKYTTRCGYVRRDVTSDPSKVTCPHCLKKLKEQ